MTIRDLTEKQRKKLVKECTKSFEQRNKGRPVLSPLDWIDYRTAFSDGVFYAMKLLLPDKPYGPTK